MDASEVKESSPKTHGELKQNNSAIVYLDIYNSRLLTVTVSTGVPGFFPSSTAKLYIFVVKAGVISLISVRVIDKVAVAVY